MAALCGRRPARRPRRLHKAHPSCNAPPCRGKISHFTQTDVPCNALSTHSTPGTRVSILLCSPNMAAPTTRNAMLSLCNNNISIHRLSFRALSATADTPIKTLCHTNRLQEALDAFKHQLSPKSTSDPTPITCNVLLSSVLRRKQHECEFSVYRLMIEADILPDIIINCHGETGRMDHALKLFEGMDYALKVFEGMEAHGYVPDVVTFNTLIKGLCRKFRVEDAIKLFNQMRSKQLAPSLVTYNTLIDGFCKTGKCHEAFGLLAVMMQKGHEPDTFTFNTLMDRLCKEGKLQEVKKLLYLMIKEGCNPDAITYNILINGLCKEGKLDEARSVFYEMCKKNICPDVVTYSALMDGLCKERQWQEVPKVLHEMLNKMCKPDVITCSTVIDGLCKEGKLREDLGLLDVMVQIANPPNDPGTSKKLIKDAEKTPAIQGGTEPAIQGAEENEPTHMVLEEGGSLYKVFLDRKLVGTFEGDPFKALSNQSRDTPPLKFFHMMLGTVPKGLYTRNTVAQRLKALLPHSQHILGEVSSPRKKDVFFHVGIKLTSPPRKRKLYLQILRAFPEVQEDQLRLEGRSGWRVLCNRIRREDKEYIYYGKEDPPRQTRSRPLQSFIKRPRGF